MYTYYLPTLFRWNFLHGIGRIDIQTQGFSMLCVQIMKVTLWKLYFVCKSNILSYIDFQKFTVGLSQEKIRITIMPVFF